MTENYFEEIKNLILEYKNQNRSIDRDYITNFFEIMLVARGLENYLKTIQFKFEKKQNIIVGYNSLFKRLNIYVSNLSLSLVNIYDIEALKQESDFLSFFCLNEIFSHEIEHMMHTKIYEEKKSDLESNIIRMSCKFDIVRNQKLTLLKRLYLRYLGAMYDKYFTIVPDERLANLYSYQASRKIADLLNLPQISMWEHLQELKLYTRKNAGKSPTLAYLKKICSPKEFHALQEQIESSSLSLENRLKYGLEITPLEFEQILIQKKEL